MRWTEDKVDWLRKNKSNCNNREELLNAFNKAFNTDVVWSQLNSRCKYYKISLRFNVLWEDKIEWLIKSKDLYGDREDILNAFNEHFNLNLKINRLNDINHRYKLSLPVAKRLMMNNIESGWVKLRGYKTLPVGSDIHRNNSIRLYIKKEDGSYEIKSRHIYQTYHKVKLDPVDDVIVFLDNDYTNFSIENLYLMKRSVQGIMASHGFYKNKTFKKETLIRFAEWKDKIFKLSRQSLSV